MPGIVKAGILTPPTESFFGLSGVASYIAATFAGLFVGTFAFGFVADKLGRRAVFTWSLLWYCACAVVMACQTDARGLNFWRLMTGIECHVSHAVYHHGWWELQRPITPIAAQMNLGYALAVAVIDGAAMVAQFAPQRIDQDDVWALIPKVVALHDPEFDKGGPLKRGSASVRVTLADGTVLEHMRTLPKSIGEPMSTESVTAKFRALTQDLMDRPRAEAIVNAVLGLEDLDDVRPLIELLAAPVRSTFE